MQESSDEFVDRITPKPKPWQDFEAEVAEHVRKDMEFLRIGLDPKTARVRSRPSYFSQQRGSEIIFDINIEVWPIPEATMPTLLWIWECKNYPDRRVTVDEVEEFQHKLMQVGAHKGTIATRCGFASGAISVAKSNGVALLTLNQEQVTYFAFSASAGLMDKVECRPEFCLTSSGDSAECRDLEDYINLELEATGLMTGW